MCKKPQVWKPTWKSQVSAGIDDDTRNQIIKRTGFAVGEFPIKYLGLPLSPKKWRKTDCWSLIDKITQRIKVTYSKKLSYAGRL
ncbi:hypothetical protein KY290_032934 [Solanum tuberosum]|uniref:Uncharacterized protein n=1 Tax=Solanum tuberosum TaxID=4113 RepID=A0ABQ7UDF8_SOLTU|nr:hypothetical protein KY284_031477 [Solanum tuberosum]KAH0654194.1 hypothetical protein KY289_031872 [Solanum tuberosum]KAH0656806.1 hypothetical protein KY285_031688 [Solanum tuberosum]KAH0744941.1 hypothetical protein KY290_032934 [Solanum tuberosum]